MTVTGKTSIEGGVSLPISVIVLTFNEEINIAGCLESLDWADDVIVVDSYSSDATNQRARQTRPGVRVVQHAFKDFGDQRNWALDHAQPRNPWVLFLDADERSTPAFAEKVEAAIRNPGDKVGFYLSCRNIFLDRWIKHCTLYPSWQLRLLKLGEVRFRKEGHGQREVTEGPLGYIAEPYDHFLFSKGIAEWIRRQEVYSSNETELLLQFRREPLRLRDLLTREPLRRRRCLKRLAARTILRPFFSFVYFYVLRRGFLEGRPGLLFCLLRAAHDIHISAKLEEACVKAETSAGSAHSQRPG